MSRKKVIGIDLGTSKCCVGVVRDCKVEILENERGNKTTPSYVAFTDTERLVGEDAKDQATLNPANTVFGVKRIIGRELNDALLKEAVDKMPYTIMDGSDEENSIRVSYRGTKEFLLPQQITAMLLSKMKDLAERHLKSNVEEVVISVPASFTNAQRQATKDAATIAGLKVLALINEPTAAAIAYATNRRMTDEETIAVVDFGAGNLSVAIVTVRRGQVTVRAISGKNAIGGYDIDEVLMQCVGSKFEDKHGQKLPESSAMTERLRSCCEKLKLKLTLLPKVQETLDCFGDDAVLPVTINRADFNEMLPVELHSSLKSCFHRVIEASRVPQKEISRVVLVGGSSRIPQFQTWSEEIFGTKPLDKSVNPDEAVACGAALYAALLSGDNELEDITVNDCVPNDFRFSRQGDSTLHHVFEQYSSKTLPRRRKFPFTLQSPFNKTTHAHTFELYEELSGQKNPHRLLGTVCLDDEFRQAVCLITDMSFEVDRCGILNVVVQLDRKHDFPEVVKKNASKLSKGKIQNAIERERQFRKDDQDEKERVEAMSCLEALSFRLQSAMNNSKTRELFPDMVKRVSDKAKENIEWLDVASTVTRAECVKREKSLEKLNNHLKLQVQEHEKEECERDAAINRLNDYLLELEAFLSSADVSEESEQASDIERQVAKTKQWLQSTETPSKNDCIAEAESLKKLHNSLENRLEEKARERERVTAVNNLLDYCNHLETTLANDSSGEAKSDSAKRLIERARASICWVNTTKDISSQAACEARKKSLKALHDQVVAERAAAVEADLTKAMKSLQSFCNHLTSNLLESKAREKDPEMYAMLKKEVDFARVMLGNKNSISKDECIKQLAVLNNLEKTVRDSTKEYNQSEENRVATQKKFEAYASKIKSSRLNNEARKIEYDLVRQISLQIAELSNWLKQRDQFSENKYNEKVSYMDRLIQKLEVKLAEAEKSKTLTDKAKKELSSFTNNSTSATRHEGGAGNGNFKRSSRKDNPRDKSTYEGMPSSNEAATALQTTGPADTHEDGTRKRTLRNAFGLLPN